MNAEELSRLATHPKMGHQGNLDQAAAVKKLAENNQLNMLPPAQREQAIARAASFGVKPKDLIGGMDSATIANTINTNQYDAEARSKGLKTLAERNDLNLIGQGLPPAQQHNLRQRVLNEGIQHGVKISDLTKSDYRYRDYDTGPTGRVTVLGAGAPAGSTPAQRLDYGRRLARQEQLEGMIGGMAGQQRRNIDTADITPELIAAQSMNAGIIRDFRTADVARIACFGTPGSIAAGTTGVINPAIDAALTAAEAAAAGPLSVPSSLRHVETL